MSKALTSPDWIRKLSIEESNNLLDESTTDTEVRNQLYFHLYEMSGTISNESSIAKASSIKYLIQQNHQKIAHMLKHNIGSTKEISDLSNLNDHLKKQMKAHEAESYDQHTKISKEFGDYLSDKEHQPAFLKKES